MDDIWNRELTELIRSELSEHFPRTVELINLLAENPGRKFNQDELAYILQHKSRWVPRSLLGNLTTVSKNLGTDQSKLHSWFVLWEDQPEFRYWLSQERSDWWLGKPDRQYWIYKPDQANDSALKINVGDRAAVISKAEHDGSYIVNGLIEITEILGDRTGSAAGSRAEGNRQMFNYRSASSENLPVTLTDVSRSLQTQMAAAENEGDSIQKLSLSNWNELLEISGGWRETPASGHPKAWTQRENRETVKTYLEMLKLELQGTVYTKAEYRRELIPKLNRRSHGAVEYKFQNISAVLFEQDFPYIEGYKPMPNYQRDLADEVGRQINSAYPEWNTVVEVEEEDSDPVRLIEIRKTDEIFVDPPAVRKTEEKSGAGAGRGVHIDYLGRERRNRKLGKAGEKFVLEVEQKRLQEAGRDDLAENIRWVSEKDGDGLGYDILSFDVDGSVIYIEVKTTKLGIETPFFASSNEVEVSDQIGDAYRLYRVYNFKKGREPNIYILSGPISEACVLTAASYRAHPAGGDKK